MRYLLLCVAYFCFLLFLRSLAHFGSKHHPLVALLKARCATHPRLPRPKFRWRQRRAKRGWRALLRRMNQLVSREATTAPLRLPQTRRPPQRRRRPWRRAARRTSPKWRCGRSAPTARPSRRRKGRGEGGVVTSYSRCQTAPRRFSRIHTGERRQNTRHDKEEKTSRSLGAPHHHPRPRPAHPSSARMTWEIFRRCSISAYLVMDRDSIVRFDRGLVRRAAFRASAGRALCLVCATAAFSWRAAVPRLCGRCRGARRP